MSFNLGVNVVEVDGLAAPSIQPAATSVAGFIIKSKRGVPGKVVPITSWVRFVEHFGDHMDDAVGAYAIAGFFANGGTTAYVTRLVPRPTTQREPGEDREPDGADEDVVATDEDEGPGSDSEDDTPTDGTEDESESDGAPHPASRVFTVTSTTFELTAAYKGEDDPGAWGNDIAVRFTASETGRGVDLAIRYPGVDGRDVETFEGLVLSNRSEVEQRINSLSKFVKIDFGGSTTSASGDDFVPLGPASDESTSEDMAEPGQDGTFDDAELTNRAVAALALLETAPIQLLACPETADAGFTEEALSHCEELGDRMFVGHIPLVSGRLDESSLQDPSYANLRGEKRYGALYGPDVLVFDPLRSKPRSIPPTGHVLGVYARTDRERGIWKAPAGDAARLRGVVDVSDRVNDRDHTRFVKQYGVNLVRPIPGKGIVIDSARTLSTDTKWLYVNVRLLFNFVKSSLKHNLRWVIGEPNDASLWGRVEFDVVRPFLLGLWRAGAFGSGTPEQTFTIKIDGENNTESEIQHGRMNLDVFFYPSRPAETIVVRVGQQPGASSTSES